MDEITRFFDRIIIDPQRKPPPKPKKPRGKGKGKSLYKNLKNKFAQMQRKRPIIVINKTDRMEIEDEN